MSLENLLSKANSYIKLAGLLQLPQHLQKEIEEWATSVYCHKLYNKLQQETYNISNRQALYNKILKLSEDNGPIDFLRNQLENGQPEDILPTEYAFEAHISYFNESIDDKTRLQGIYDWVRHPPSLKLFIYKHISKDVYNFSLHINHADVKIDIELLKNISRKQVIDHLIEN